MSSKKGFDYESIIFDYIDQIKFLFFPDQWNSALFDYSKNEVLALLFLYRNKKANMSEIAAYINAPLNTATGVISRLERKLMVERIRDKDDRRVVNIVLTKKAEEFIDDEKKSIGYYFKEVYEKLTDEERLVAMSIFNKVLFVLKQGKSNTNDLEKSAKKVRRITIE